MSQSKSILIVEDDQMLQAAFSAILIGKNYDVNVASDGEAALRLTSKVKYDLIILDFFMPIMDGMEFLKRLNKQKYPNLKILVASNISDDYIKTKMLELGADDMVLKANLTSKSFIAEVQALLAN